MKIHYTHANFRVPPAQKLDRPQGFVSRDKFFPIFFHFHSPAILTLNGQEYRTAPHACIFVGGKTPHAMEVEKTILHDWIIFDAEDDFEPLLEKLGLHLDTVYYPESYEKVTELCERIEKHWFESDEFFPVYFNARMCDLLLLLAREKNHKAPEEDEKSKVTNDMLVYSVRKHLLKSPHLANYSEERIARIANCSRSTLFRHYRALFGCSPYEDLQKACLTRSERYLLESDFTVEEISELLGYKSSNVFIRRFKQRYGTTPKEWRKRESQKALPANEKKRKKETTEF